MSQAEELLNGMSENVPAHSHPVPDTDTYFVIDPITRAIENPNRKKTVIMQFDHNSERFTFGLPRYVDGHDMLECTSVTVNVDNIEVVESDGGEKVEARVNSDAPDMTDLRIHPDDPEKVISSWLISRNSTQLAGILSFHIEFKCVDAGGNVVYEWSTDTYAEIEVRARKKNGAAAVAEHSDLLEQWRTRIFGAGNSVMANIAAEGEAQVAAVKAESQTQQEAVELKGANTLETIPEEYTEVDAMATEAVRTKADAIVCEAAGKPIAIKDSSDDHIRGLKVFGKTTQVTTTGAQLMPQPYYDSSMVRHGVTFTVNDDGSITMVGTNTAGDSVSCYFMLHSGFSATGIHTYKCYGLPETCVTNIYYRGDAVGDTEILLDLYEPNEYGFVIRVKAGATVNATVYPMLNAGETALPYEPYTGGKPGPNPDYPQGLVSIENPRVEVYGKNLLEITRTSGTTGVGCDIVVNDDGSVIINGTAVKEGSIPLNNKLVLPVGDYVISGEKTTVSLRTDATTHLGTYFSGKTVSITSPDQYLFVCVYANKNQVFDNFKTYPMIRAVQYKDDLYEVYADKQSIGLNRTLPGIPVTSGGNYTDERGQQWICDEIDLERGVHVQRLLVNTITDFSKAGVVAPVDGYTEGSLYLRIDLAQQIGLCDKFAYMQSGVCDRFAVLLNGGLYFTIAGEYTADEWKAKMSELAPTVALPLATPIETPLTAEEIAAFKVLRTNYPNTTILNDAGAWMSVKYNADTKSYVDNPKTLRLTDTSTGVVYELKIVDGSLTVVPV